jgi:hypothetical protein
VRSVYGEVGLYREFRSGQQGFWGGDCLMGASVERAVLASTEKLPLWLIAALGADPHRVLAHREYAVRKSRNVLDSIEHDQGDRHGWGGYESSR